MTTKLIKLVYIYVGGFGCKYSSKGENERYKQKLCVVFGGAGREVK